jgi:hypothetical protein
MSSASHAPRASRAEADAAQGMPSLRPRALATRFPASAPRACVRARAQLALGDEREARRWLDAALELPITNLDDETAHVEASKLASSLSG